MKIQREINGVLMETELTHDELFKAYCEYENWLDRGICLDFADNTDEYLDLDPDEQKRFIIDMADYFRSYMDMGDWNIDDALDAALYDVCQEFIPDEEDF